LNAHSLSSSFSLSLHDALPILVCRLQQQLIICRDVKGYPVIIVIHISNINAAGFFAYCTAVAAYSAVPAGPAADEYDVIYFCSVALFISRYKGLQLA